MSSVSGPMSPRQLLDQLSGAGIFLRVESERLLCSAPDGALTPEFKAAIAAAKPAIVAFLRAGASASSSGEAQGIKRRSPDQEVPLSLSQEGIWFAPRAGVPEGVSNLPAAFWLKGALSVQALRDTLREIVARHESLRTSIVEREGRPFQEIHEQQEPCFEQFDVSSVPESLRRKEIISRIRRDAASPIDFLGGSAVRFGLYRLSKQEHAFSLVAHQMTWDGWSFDVFMKELSAIYAAKSQREEHGLVPLTVHYGDFAIWQRDWVRSESYARQLAYWRESLKGDLLPLRIPTDRPRPPRMSYAGAIVEAFVAPETTARLTELARRQGATLYMVLSAGLCAVLQRYAQQSHDIIVGCPNAGTSQPELESMIGFFVNTLAMRYRVADDPSFAELVARVKRANVGAYGAKDVPIGNVLAELKPPRDPSRTPLYQVIFTYQDAHARSSKMGDIEIEQLHVDRGLSRTDLMFWVKEYGNGLPLGLEYSTDLFDTETAECLLDNFVTLLSNAATNPHSRCSRLDILGPLERKAVDAFESQYRPPSAEREPHRFFEQLCDEDPTKVACRVGVLSYTRADLEQRANRIANGLLALNLKPGDAVAICLERSVDLVASLIGTLKAGAAYALVDPDAPAEWVRHASSACSAAIAREASCLSNALRTLPLEPSLCGLNDPTRPNVHVADDELACLQFDPAATLPSGLGVTRVQHARAFTALMDDLGSSSGAVFSSVAATYGAAWELLGAVAAGWVLVLDPVDNGAGTCADRLRSSGATMHACTPQQARLLLDDPAGMTSLACLPHLRLQGAGADLELMQHLHSALNGGSVAVSYVCPAAPFVCATHRFDSASAELCLGRPLPGLKIAVVDEHGNTLPAGVVGRLAISGPNAAQSKSATPRDFAAGGGFDGSNPVYVANTWSKRKADGRIEPVSPAGWFTSSSDAAELAHVERTLRNLEGVQEAAVTLRGVPGTEQARLVGYYRPQRGCATSPAEIACLLRTSLPRERVPADVVQVADFPFTWFGTIDCDALPAPPERTAMPSSAEERHSHTQLALISIWSDILGTEVTSVHDDFFDLGGQSLLAAQMIDRVRARWGGAWNLRTVFDAPTIDSLARIVDGADEAARYPARSFFFQSDGHQLHGVYHPPRSRLPARHAVLLCSPGGQEYMRSHWALRQLAEHITVKGCACLRFDYFASGDSEGSAEEGNARQWLDDVSAAAKELCQRAGTHTVSLVGLRLGALLAANACPLLVGIGLGVEKLVLWDCPADGVRYLKELEHLHEAVCHIRFPRRRAVPTSAGGAQQVGFPMPESLVESIAPLTLVKLALPPRSTVHIVYGEADGVPPSIRQTLARAGVGPELHHVPDSLGWDDPKSIEKALLVPRSVQVVCQLVAESNR